MSRLDADLLKKFFKDEVPSGTINGSNTNFTLSSTPFDPQDAVQVYLDGLKQKNGTDFTISGTTITFATAPAIGQNVEVFYIILRGEN